jgi:hypothetical protein
MKTLKTFVSVWAILNIVGCATSAPISYQEHCANKGMMLASVTDTDSSAAAYGSNGSTAYARGNAESVSCEVPKTEVQSCEVRRLGAVAGPKVEYNSGLTGKKWVTGIGYVLYVLPGVGAKLYYDSKLDKAVAQSQKIDAETKDACVAKAAPARPAPSNPEVQTQTKN